MMANHLFQVTQGSNFDTATINDPYLVFKKQEQLAKARNTIYSSIDNENKVVPAVDSILDNSFVGPLANVIYGVRDAFAEILISDRKNIRKVMQEVLRPYIGLNDRDFIKVSQKAVNDLFDWAVQNNRKLNNSVKKILLGTATEKSAAREIIEFRDKVLKDKTHPLFNNLILKSIQLESGKKIVLDEYELRDGNTYKRENINIPLLVKLGYSPKESRKMMNMIIPQVDNLSIKGRDGKVYDQNLIIYGFEELKEKLGDENKDLYGKLVRLAVIQSGLTNSPIAFTNLLPYEDFREFYNETLSNLENIPNLADFRQLDIMERSNWNNANITTFKKGRLQQSKKNPNSWYYPEKQFLSKKLEKKMLSGELPPMIVFSMFSREGSNDFVVYSSEGKITKAQRIKARRTGDTSHVEKGLFKKVYTVNEDGKRVPLVQESEYQGKFYFNYVYKAVNAWGDSFKAQEFYGKTFPLDPLSTVSRASVLDNGFIKVQYTENAEKQQLSPDEVEDSAIELALTGVTPNVAIIQQEEAEAPAAETREKSTIERILKDGNAYNIDDIKLGMLIKMGYTPSEVGEILKEIRKEIC
jgi:Holliday junction resolvasome RuvABC DNA-binding subunit